MAMLTRGNIKDLELVDRTGAVIFRASLVPARGLDNPGSGGEIGYPPLKRR